MDMAIQQYRKCLTINPSHKEAQASLQLLTKKAHRPNFNIDFLDGENGGDVGLNSSKGKEEFEEGGDRKSRRRHKEEKKKHRKSGGNHSSSDSDSSSSSRFSSSGSDDSSHERSRSKKARRSKKSKREASLSPFSKKMAQLNPTSAPTMDAGPALSVPVTATVYPSTEYPSIATRPMPVPPPFGTFPIPSGLDHLKVNNFIVLQAH